jgi:acyltransferase-like protein
MAIAAIRFGMATGSRKSANRRGAPVDNSDLWITGAPVRSNGEIAVECAVRMSGCGFTLPRFVSQADHRRKQMPTKRAYSPGIDGLRALAVIAVFAYHAGGLRGGFLGVDIFFVISGYLITDILARQRRT